MAASGRTNHRPRRLATCDTAGWAALRRPDGQALRPSRLGGVGSCLAQSRNASRSRCPAPDSGGLDPSTATQTVGAEVDSAQQQDRRIQKWTCLSDSHGSRNLALTGNPSRLGCSFAALRSLRLPGLPVPGLNQAKPAVAVSSELDRYFTGE